MLKKFVSSLLALLLLVGCGSSSGGSKESASDQASGIIKDLELGDVMEEVGERVVKGLFFFEDGLVEDGSVYVANDKSANVVAVFKTKDVTAVEENVKDYLVTLKDQMESYFPDEVFKVDNAVVADNGKEVVLIVAENIEEAKKIADKYLGK